MKDVPVHDTIRPLVGGQVVWQKPGAELAQDVLGMAREWEGEDT